MSTISAIAALAGDITCIGAIIAMLVKPVRRWLFSDREVREGQRCLLRSQIAATYYRRCQDKCLHEYEYENLVYCYKAYKALGGNSFIDRIYEEMRTWAIVQ